MLKQLTKNNNFPLRPSTMEALITRETKTSVRTIVKVVALR
jgi:hypothetical protein